jgi:hypothetical protein
MTGVESTYSTYRAGRGHMGVQALLSVASIVGLTILALRPDPATSPVFRLLFLAGATLITGYHLYWTLFRIAYRLELTQTELRWYAPLRHGRLALTELREVNPALSVYTWGARNGGALCEEFTTASGRRVLSWAHRKGFQSFAEDLRHAAPQVRIKVSWTARCFQRVPQPSGYERLDPSPWSARWPEGSS